MKPPTPSDPPRQTLHLSGGPVAYTDVGSGPVVLALHGCPGSVRDFRWLGAALEPYTRFVRVDLPGFGETPLSTFRDASFEGRGRFLREVIESLGLERVTPIGHSAGGPLALELAATYPDRCVALAMLGSPGLRPHKPLRRSPIAHSISPFLRIPGVSWPLTGLLRHGFESVGFPKDLPDEAVQQTMHIIAKLNFEHQRLRVRRLHVPTLLAWTKDDAFIDFDIVDEMATQCPAGPRLRFEEGGHYLQKTRSVEIADAMVPWLQELHGISRRAAV